MTGAIETIAVWLVDYYLLAMALLAPTLVALFVVKQPAQRLAITEATLVALVLLAILTALPGWSVVHLLTAQQPRPNGSPEAARDVIQSHSTSRIDSATFRPADEAAELLATKPTDFAQPANTAQARFASPNFSWQLVLVGAHTVGALGVAAWLALGALAAYRLRRSACPAPPEIMMSLSELSGGPRSRVSPRLGRERLADGRLEETAQRESTASSINQVELLLSDRIEVAVALGVWRPVVLLPTNWIESEAASALRSVVAHEIAHVRAHDLRWLAVSRALLLLMWAQPLFWLLRRWMRLDQETLADAAGAELSTRQQYAEQLVAWARDAKRRPALHLSSAVGLWEGPSQLKRRIALLLDDRLTILRDCSRKWRGGAIVLATTLAVLLSFVTLEPAGHAETTESSASSDNTKGAASTETNSEAQPSAVELDYLRVRVVDDAGSPIPAVTLELAGVKIPSGPSLIAITDDQGIASVPYPGMFIRKLGNPSQLLQATHPSFVSVYHSVKLGTTDETVLRMARGGAVELTGFTSGSEEIASHIYGMATTLSQNAEWSKTGANSIRSPQLPAGETWVRIVAFPPDGPTLFSEVRPVTVSEGKTESRRLELKPGKKLEGRIDDSVPRPVTNGRAIVWIRSSKGDHTWTDSTMVDDDGSFAFDSLPLDSGTEAQLVAICDGFVSQPSLRLDDPDRGLVLSPHIVPIGRGSTRCELSMIPTSKCIATIRDPSGNAIEGVRIVTFPSIQWNDGVSSLLVEASQLSANERIQGGVNKQAVDGSVFGIEATSDENGQAELTNLPPFDNYITASHQEYELLPQSIGGQQLPVWPIKLSSGKTTALNLAMLALDADSANAPLQPTELAGRVVDESGKPLANVTVDVWTWHPGNETTTAADGRFKLTGFEPNEALEVEFRHPGYGPRLFVEQSAGTQAWIATMKNDTFLEGRVLSSEGAPVPNAKVRAKRGPFENPGVVIGEVWTETIADDDGRYRLYLEPDRYDVQIRISDAGLARHEGIRVQAGEQKQFDIQLQRGPTFNALVLDSESNEPVAGIRLWNWMQPGIEGVSNADGLVTIENMLPGEFEFIVSAANDARPREIAGEYARWWSAEAIHGHERRETPTGATFQRNLDSLTFDIEDRDEPVKIFVEKCVTIRGRVVDPEGNPVAGATIAPAKTGSGNSLTGDTRYSYETKEDGTFEMRLPASGNAEYNLVAHDGKYQEWRRWANGIGELLETKPGETLTGVALRLSKPCIVRGKVVDAAGKPVAGHEVRAQSADKLENRYYDPTTKSNAQGEFELAFVRPGDHIIQADPFWLVAEEGPRTGWKRVTASPGKPIEGIVFREGEPLNAVGTHVLLKNPAEALPNFPTPNTDDNDQPDELNEE